MSERIKLQEPGSELVMYVNSVKPEKIEQNDYYLFTGGDGKELVVPQSSVNGQLERLGVASVEGIVQSYVRFSRSTKMSRAGKPFWNLDPAEAPKKGNGSGAEQSVGGEAGALRKPAATASATPPSTDSSPDERDKALLAQRAVYATRMKQSVAYVLENIEPLFKAKEIGLTGDEVYKFAFSVWKGWDDHGVMQ